MTYEEYIMEKFQKLAEEILDEYSEVLERLAGEEEE